MNGGNICRCDDENGQFFQKKRRVALHQYRGFLSTRRNTVEAHLAA